MRNRSRLLPHARSEKMRFLPALALQLTAKLVRICCRMVASFRQRMADAIIEAIFWIVCLSYHTSGEVAVLLPNV